MAVAVLVIGVQPGANGKSAALPFAIAARHMGFAVFTRMASNGPRLRSHTLTWNRMRDRLPMSAGKSGTPADPLPREGNSECGPDFSRSAG